MIVSGRDLLPAGADDGAFTFHVDRFMIADGSAPTRLLVAIRFRTVPVIVSGVSSRIRFP
jgi:hypothetical protein